MLPVSSSPGSAATRNACGYFFLPDPKDGCQLAVAPFWLGAAAMILTLSFFGFFASRLLLAMPAPWVEGEAVTASCMKLRCLKTNSYRLLADNHIRWFRSILPPGQGSVLQRSVDERSMAPLRQSGQRFEDDVKLPPLISSVMALLIAA